MLIGPLSPLTTQLPDHADIPKVLRARIGRKSIAKHMHSTFAFAFTLYFKMDGRNLYYQKVWRQNILSMSADNWRP